MACDSLTAAAAPQTVVPVLKATLTLVMVDSACSNCRKERGGF